MGEAVNFATFAWVPFGRKLAVDFNVLCLFMCFIAEADERYRQFARPAVFSYVRLFFTLLHNSADIPVKYRNMCV